MSIDQASYDLAALFLKDVKNHTKEDIQELAEQIQQTVEDFISGMFEDEE